MSFDVIRKNKILAKNFELTVVSSVHRSHIVKHKSYHIG